MVFLRKVRPWNEFERLHLVLLGTNDIRKMKYIFLLENFAILLVILLVTL